MLLRIESGAQEIRPINLNLRYALIAFMVGSVAGVVIIGLGASNVFGSVGSTAFIGSVSGGGVLTLLSGGGMVWIALEVRRSRERQEEPSFSTHTVEHQETAAVTVTDEPAATPSKTPDNAQKKETEPTKPKPIGPVVQKGVYSAKQMEVFAFAREALRAHPGTKPTEFALRGESYQPINQEIALLTTLYNETYYPAFVDLLKTTSAPWSDPKVIQAAEDLLKIGYVISCLTLEEVDQFTDKVDPRSHVNRTREQALVMQDSYQFRTYFYCTRAYHLIRGGAIWKVDGERAALFYPKPNEVQPGWAEKFYTENTQHSDMTLLYNDFCDRVRVYVDVELLKREDGRFTAWIRKDEGNDTFTNHPGSIPS